MVQILHCRCAPIAVEFFSRITRLARGGGASCPHEQAALTQHDEKAESKTPRSMK
jgi:hypothetical protein